MDRDAEQGLFEMSERLAHVEPPLDELARERVLARIHAELSGARGARRGRAAGYAWMTALAAAASFLVWWARAPRAQAPVTKAPTAVQRPQRQATAPLPALELVPYLLSGGSAARADALLAHAQSRIELAAGERLLAALGERARLALVGPATLRVRRAQRARVELELEQGLLLGDYDHAQGGALLIASPGAQTEIVGTLFSVQARGNESRVAVARGKVRVRAEEQLIEVGTGSAWRAGMSTAEKLPESAAAELALHARSLRPSAGAHGILGITGEQLEAELGAQWLGPTPLWAVVPAGSHTIALRDVRAGGRKARSLEATVRSAERTELLVEPSKQRAAPRLQGDPEQPTAAALYADAERAMRDGELDRASALLEELLATFPAASNRDLALYDLALAAYKRGEFARATALLERLEAEPLRPSLRELAAYLRCRALHARVPEQAPACLAEFRRRFPDSPHAREAWTGDGGVAPAR